MNLNKSLLYHLLLFTAFLSTSCGSLKKANTLFQSEYDKFADTAKSVYIVNHSTDADTLYRIKPFDLIGVRNVQNVTGLVATADGSGTEPTSTFRADAKGVINLPAIGKIDVNNLNRIEAAAKIQKLYAEKLFKDPIIDVSIINLKVTLLGDVTKPGNYQLDHEDMNLIDLIGESGGLLPTSDASKVKIIRGDLKQPEVIYVNLRSINSLASPSLVLQNNDIIYVPTRNVYLASEGIKNYSNFLQPALVLLNAFLVIYTISR